MPDEPDAPLPGGPADTSPPREERTLRAGLDVAREALAAARAAAKARGQNPSRDGAAGATRTRRGDGRRRSGAHPDDRDPQPLGRTLDRLVADRGWDLSLRVHGVFGRWPQIVGAEVAQHCEPESFADGRLVVRTDATAWATQLRLLAPTILRRLNEELGEGTVTLIEVLGPQGPSWTKGRRSVRGGRGPRDTYG